MQVWFYFFTINISNFITEIPSLILMLYEMITNLPSKVYMSLKEVFGLNCIIDEQVTNIPAKFHSNPCKDVGGVEKTSSNV